MSKAQEAPEKKKTPGAFGKEPTNKDYAEIWDGLEGVGKNRQPYDISGPAGRNKALLKQWSYDLRDAMNAINKALGLTETESGYLDKNDAEFLNQADQAELKKQYLKAIDDLMKEPAPKLRRDFLTINEELCLKNRPDKQVISIESKYLEPLYDIIIV
jgi:hypothetical protein